MIYVYIYIRNYIIQLFEIAWFHSHKKANILFKSMVFEVRKISVYHHDQDFNSTSVIYKLLPWAKKLFFSSYFFSCVSNTHTGLF